MLWIALALAGKSSGDTGLPVTIKVVDANGGVVPTATVVWEAEQDEMRVNTVDGTATTNVLYPTNGKEVTFAKGMTQTVTAFAPGFARTPASVTFAKKNNLFTIALRPLPTPAKTDDTGLLGAQQKALAAATTWASNASTYATDPSYEAEEAMKTAREHTHHFSLEWAAYTRELGAPDPAAIELCRIATTRPETCPRLSD